MAGILKVDQIAEANSGQGVRLNHALKNSSGTEIMSAAGVFSSNINGGTISNATLDSTVTFPAGVIIDVELYDETTSSGALTATAGFGTERSITLNSGQKVLINIFGGALENREDSSSTLFAAVQYDTSSLTSTSGSFKNGSSAFIDIRAAGGGSQHRIQVGAGAKLLYTAGSNLTLYFRPAVVVSSGTCNWRSDSNKPIQLAVYKIQ